jgi:hypothetical protein
VLFYKKLHSANFSMAKAHTMALYNFTLTKKVSVFMAFSIFYYCMAG